MRSEGICSVPGGPGGERKGCEGWDLESSTCTFGFLTCRWKEEKKGSDSWILYNSVPRAMSIDSEP